MFNGLIQWKTMQNTMIWRLQMTKHMVFPITCSLKPMFCVQSGCEKVLGKGHDCNGLAAKNLMDVISGPMLVAILWRSPSC